MLVLMKNLEMFLDRKTAKTSKNLFWLHWLPKHVPEPAEDQHIKLHRESPGAISKNKNYFQFTQFKLKTSFDKKKQKKSTVRTRKTIKTS